MGFTHPIGLRSAAFAVAALITTSLFVSISPAVADTSPETGTPETVSTDMLATPQIDGVVWSQVIVGNTVYVGGDFKTARPFGAAAGANTVARTHLLAYNIETGVLDPSFAPVLDGQVRGLAASPDGKRLYAVGEFAKVNGLTRSRIAAFDLPSGTLNTTFKPIANTRTNAVTATNTAVYVGGWFTSVKVGTTTYARTYAAGLDAATGAVLPFAPQIAGGTVTSMVASPTGDKVIIGGSFTTVNGSGNPGYGLAAVSTDTSTLMPWAVNAAVRNGGTQASITSLSSDADSVYGTGYVFGQGGNLEGAFRASWADGTLNWVEDCHGDSYGVAPAGNTIYVVSHAHYCGNVGGFPQTEPDWTTQRAMAWSKAATGPTITADPHGYFNWAGKPSPSILNWWPDLTNGSYTGQGQAAWAVAANDKYVVLGGEFIAVNGKFQQGLTRFAVKSIAPNKDAPRLTGANFVPSAVSLASGTARLSWLANYDRDNENLSYQLIRDNDTTNPVYTTTAKSRIWYQRPTMGFIDTGLTPGQTYNYKLRVVDPFGNAVTGNNVSVTVSSDSSVSEYAQTVLDDSPVTFWRLDEASGSTVFDWTGWNDATASASVTRGTAGAILTDDDTASSFNGSNGFVATQTAQTAPDTFSVEAWFKTTSTSGGKIVGFGNAKTGNSSSYDRHVFMDESGRVYFGVYPGSERRVQSAAGLNDGQWHQVVASLSPSGMQLSIDGKRVGQRTDTTSGQSYSGYWRVGGDNSWQGAPYFNGSIDDVAIYDKPLSTQTVNAHFVASGRDSALPVAPSDAYGAAVYSANPDLYWRLGETAGTVALDAGSGDADGTYFGGVTQGGASGIAGTTNGSAAFNGSDGVIVSKKQFVNPQVYSLELWFNSTTNRGGKLIGFGTGASGTSSSYDRHIYLQDNGQLVFGTYTGALNTITSPASYTDGAWHQVVATQSSAGLRLYVDGSLVGANPATAAEGYTGYWRVGGDNTWGSSSAFVNAQIDEVSVYPVALSQATITQHRNLGAGIMPNQKPQAAFAAVATDLSVATNASSSSDPDGTTLSYAWNFGDGASAVGPTADHTYTEAGSYDVTLTVTDDDGATDSLVKSIAVTAPNLAPTALFTTSTNGLTTTVNGSASSDSDGTVDAFAWDFGDGATATTATATHTYQTSGVYTVSLTVTDNRGAVATLTKDVSAIVANVAPSASFEASVNNLAVSVSGATSNDPDGTIVGYVWSFGDGSSATTAQAAHTYSTEGTFTVTLTVTDNDGAATSTSQPVTVNLPANVLPTATFTSSAAGLALSVDASASSDSDGTIAGYAWAFGDGETAETVTATHQYATSGTFTVTLRVTDNQGGVSTSTKSVTVTAPNALPTASFTQTTNALSVAVDGTGSGDSDGTIASYAWAFGDGGTATTATANHTYATGGTFTVTLTVKDNRGGTSSTSSPVTVVAPPQNGPYAQDAFGRTTATGLGSADVGGSWTVSGTASAYAVASGAAQLKIPAAGQTLSGYLQSVASTDTEVRAVTAFQTPATGAGVYASLIGRRVGSVNYQGRIKVLPSGSVTLQLLQTGTTLSQVVVPGLTYATGDKLQLRVQVTGTSPTTIRAKVWRLGASEPTNWQLSTTDQTAALQTAGSVGVSSYLSGTSTTVPSITTFDDLRAGPTTTTPVVPTPNVAPTAAFTASPTNLTAAFSGAASSDPDGTIASYSWSFGDQSAAATGVSTSHTYATAGTYTVTLTVTDNVGATAVKSGAVTVAAVVPEDAGALAKDAFGRTSTAGWGTAEIGGAWTTTGAAAGYTIVDGAARQTTSTGQTLSSTLSKATSTASDVQTQVSLDKVATGGGVMVTVIGRRVGSLDYAAKVKFAASGSVTLQTVAGTTVLRSLTVPGLTYAAGDKLQVRLEVSGTSPTTVRAKVWRSGQAEPSGWQVTVTDSTAGLQATGFVGLQTYLSGSATNAPVTATFDNFRVVVPQ